MCLSGCGAVAARLGACCRCLTVHAGGHRLLIGTGKHCFRPWQYKASMPGCKTVVAVLCGKYSTQSGDYLSCSRVPTNPRSTGSKGVEWLLPVVYAARYWGIVSTQTASMLAQVTGLWMQLSELKALHMEPREAGDRFQAVVSAYYADVAAKRPGRGAMLMAVCRGKAREGPCNGYV